MIIYRILNKKTGQVYIGSTISFKQRKNQHIEDLNLNKHHNYKLQRDWKIFKGLDGFEFELLETGYRTRQSLLLREYELINSIPECYYNIDRICPIIKTPKEKNPTKKKCKKDLGWILKKKSKVKNSKPLKHFKHLEDIARMKKEKELNKLKYLKPY